MRGGTATPWASRMHCCVDRLSTLPDEILQHILSFLRAQEAVRTCVLAQSWRHVWKLMRQLRITGILTPASVLGIQKFVRHLFLLRLHELTESPLDLCEIIFHEFDDENIAFIKIWIKWAIMCKIQTFHLDLFREHMISHDDKPLISSHLTKIQLSGLMLSESFADFSRCSVLQDLQIVRCDLSEVRKLMSPSLKFLVITECTSAQNSRLRICVPHLVSLHLDEPSMDRIPLLESMPELVEAYVQTYWNMDSCSSFEPMDCNHIMGSSSFSDSDTDDDEVSSSYDADRDIVNSVLGSLSQATNLTLLSGDTMYIFGRDLRWCPTFMKLKSLLLNDYWSDATYCRALACILEHVPVLEKLSIIFSRKVDPNYKLEIPNYKLEIKGCLDDGAMKRSLTISQYLKIIQVKCNMVNERFLKLLKFLQSSLNIYCKQKMDDPYGYTVSILNNRKASAEVLLYLNVAASTTITAVRQAAAAEK
ncbi:hypothetical protein EJB05_28997, partial [Eragrostis curvula]